MARIYIVGAPGSGKSFIAKRLAAQLDIPWYDLDSDALYQLAPDDRDILYDRVRIEDAWICEAVALGLHRKWVHEADLVIVLVTPRIYRILRIFLRALLKGLGIRFPGQEGAETWAALRYRLRETWYYQERYGQPFIHECGMYRDRIFSFSNNIHAQKWIFDNVRRLQNTF